MHLRKIYRVSLKILAAFSLKKKKKKLLKKKIKFWREKILEICPDVIENADKIH